MRDKGTLRTNLLESSRPESVSNSISESVEVPELSWVTSKMSPTRGLSQIVKVVHIKALNNQVDVFEANRAESTNNHGLSRMVNPAILGEPQQICAKVEHRLEGVKYLLVEVREKNPRQAPRAQ